ncbi:NKAP domain containing 1 [Rhinolophus ferrumequinum]|uniref:NKAP domain containing 1 n=1 Tax=Rhinolophus ferrumequinum TaxID=59479 RepID=A0A7J7W8J3_RHIFE|nr:NKAP domain containing 1 [Rhinolophus ferrumequinum]
MSRVPLGKVLLRNVIRHTDAHNKIQEESDMWKIRELEKQMEDAYRGTKRKMLPSSSSRMRSDGFDEETQRDYWRPKSEISGALEDNFLKAKSWNKKLYDYEADMPDRQVAQLVRARALDNGAAGSIPTWARELHPPQLE